MLYKPWLVHYFKNSCFANMESPRVLVITSDQAQPGFNHERMLISYPKSREYEFQYSALLHYFSSYLAYDFLRYAEEKVQNVLNEVVESFKPDYILMHTGTSFTTNPVPIIRALLHLEKDHPNLRVGFQNGKDYTLKIVSSGRDSLELRFDVAKEDDEFDYDLISLIENANIFLETDELKELVEQVFMDRLR